MPFIRFDGNWSLRSKILLLMFTIVIVFNIMLHLNIPHRFGKIVAKRAEDTKSDFWESSDEEPAGNDPRTTPLSNSTKSTSFVNNQTRGNLTKTRHSRCPKMTIHEKDENEQFTKDRVCRPHQPTEDVCEYTTGLFTADPSIATCHDQEEPPYQLCSISEERTNVSAFKVKCDLSACNRTGVHLEIVGPSDGGMWVLDLPAGISDKEAERFVEEEARLLHKSGFSFLFVDCVDLKNGKAISQMLTVLPPDEVFKRLHGVASTSEKKLNVNVVLLDSIARPHFYRSLPKTVKHLREKQADPNYDAHIFDFELFQSVHGHTHENEHAFFNGTLFPKNYTKEEKENAPSNMEVLFGIFKHAGYQTMFQDDLCWKSYYGLIDSLKADDWTSLQEKLKGANIDSTGITDASCKINERYGDTTAFHDNDDHQICFNGKHHHRHLFDYLTHYLQAIGKTPHSKPLFSYTETNVAHENVGIRVQTLDQDLVEFIDTVSKEQNTITIIFADHGNTYTEYQVEMLEGRLEMYHPTLLTILPKQLGRKLGREIVANLRTNQYRLLNLFDIRAGLVELARYDGRSGGLNPVGIFGKISENRTCDDLQLSMPNFCICEGWDIPVENSTAQLALAEFAIGQLNNEIQEMLLASRRHSEASRNNSEASRNHSEASHHGLFGRCQPLRIQRIGNVRQRQTVEGTLMTTMDARVQSGNIVDQEELITLQVESNQKTGKTSYEMRLVSFNRISEYGFYKQCADPGLDLKLCVCNKQENNTRPARRSTESAIRDVVGPAAHISKLKRCIVLIRRTYKENVGQEDFVGLKVFELANICGNRRFNVTFNAAVIENYRSSTELPIVLTLQAMSVYFVTTMMTEVGYYKPKLKLRFRIVSQKDNGWRR